MLREEVDPEQVCALLGLCSSKLGTFNKLVTAQGQHVILYTLFSIVFSVYTLYMYVSVCVVI